MKALVLYDSFFGNTQKVAEIIGEAIGLQKELEIKDIKNLDINSFTAPDLLVVGSPTRGFRPSPATMEFLTKLPKNSLQNTKVAAFDTRMALQHIKSGVLRFIVKTGGFADKTIEKLLKKKGGVPIVPSEGFCVIDTEGPLLDGEMQRAAGWGRRISSQMASTVV